MLHNQVTPSGGVESERHVAGGEDTGTAGAHASVDLDPAALDGQAAALRRCSHRLHAPGDEDQVALGAGPAGEADPAGPFDRLHLHAQPEDTPSSSSHPRSR